VSGRTKLPSGLVTFMFTDIEGSTRLARMLGTGYHPVLGAHRALLRRTMHDFNGTELFTEGDSFFVAFSSAAAGLAACLDAQRALAAHAWPTPDARPRVRMGLHTGYATPVGREYASAEVHRAARIASAAHGGQVLCSAATARHADALPPDAELLDLGAHLLRGFDDRERLYQLVAPGLDRAFPRPRTPRASPHNLPAQLTSFVGRRAERRELTGLVDQHRLVTVVGMGGSGKTRLAVQVAADLVDTYPDGVWFVDATSVADPADLPIAVAQALGLRPEPGRTVLATLIDYVADRRMLLVIDTCDACPPAAADLVVRLLTGGGGVRVLATSREPLGVHGELVWRVPPLAVAPRTGEGPGDAVALLLDRAVAARGGRACTADERADLERIVARLDGLPLAIELAAARLRLLSATQLADRLDDVLGTLDAGHYPTSSDTTGPSSAIGPVEDTRREEHAGRRDPATRAQLLAALHATARHAAAGGAAARHASLQATVGWSYRTLGPRPAQMLRRLAVFAGPVDLPTIEWWTECDALASLSVLVDKSLLQVVAHHDGPRYRLAGPVQAYAARRLVESGEEATARDRHVDWCLEALRRTRIDTGGRPRTLSIRALDAVADEMLAAVRWCATDGGARRGLRLADGLGPWWQERGRSAEARTWFHRLYGRLTESGERVDDAELASAYLAHAEHAADADERVRFLHRAEAAAHRADDPGLLIRAVTGRSLSLLESGRLVEAERTCRDVVDQAERLRMPAAALPAVIGLAKLLWRRGALDEAAEVLGAARPAEAGRPQDRGRRTVDMVLGMVALRRGDLVAAHDHLVVALRSRMRYGFYGPAAETVNAMAVRCAVGGDPGTAALLFGAADPTRADLKRPDQRKAGLYAGFWAGQQGSVRAALGDAAFDAAYADGARLTLEQAAAVALAVEHPDLAAGSTRFVADARTLS
jgi:predicted ATPase/class 3 adenylate cyclase